jgi:hypothetical protein
VLPRIDTRVLSRNPTATASRRPIAFVPTTRKPLISTLSTPLPKIASDVLTFSRPPSPCTVVVAPVWTQVAASNPPATLTFDAIRSEPTYVPSDTYTVPPAPAAAPMARWIVANGAERRPVLASLPFAETK